MPTRIICLLVWLGANLLSASSIASSDSSRGTDPIPRPVWFEENSGQAPADVAFIGRGFGVPLAVLKSGELALGAVGSVVRLVPERSSTLATIYGEAPTGAVTRSYSPAGAGISRHYSRIRVSSLWPGADLFYRITRGQLELGLDLVAGQTAMLPSLRWRGAKVVLDGEGCVHVSARGLRFALRAPSALQPAGLTGQRSVDVHYQLDRAGRMRFRVQGADPALPLNIDPVFEFSTYIGGTQADSISAMALGPDGSIYLTGQSASTNLLGIDTGIRAGSGKVLITRLAPGGGSVLYATWIGGSGSDQGTAIAVDSSGAAYVTGNSNSSNFPVTDGAFLSTAAQDWNAIALKLDASGALVYSTLLGGSGPDWGAAIAVDNSGRAVITGQTISADFPVTAQAYQKLFAGNQDCFVTMLSSNGASLVFSTFLGGSDLDSCRAVALSPSGAITLAGSTRSPNFPVLGAFQTRTAGFLEGFVAQLASTGSTLLSSSYLGSIGDDQISSAALDSGGYVYVAGTTSTQANFPGTSAGVITKNGGGRNSFVCKIAPSLVSLNWCSIVGGAGDDYANALSLLPTGEVVVAGQTTSVNLPVVNALQSVFQGSSDGWFAVLSSSGKQWETVSYTGGSASNSVNAVQAFQDRVLLSGSTTALNFPVTAGAFQATSGGGGDGFLQEVAIESGIALNGVSPATGYGLVHSLALDISDPAGGQSIQTVQVNVSNPNSMSNACVVTFTVASKLLSLANDAGSAPAGSATAGSSVILQNSQCSVAANTSTISVTGNAVSLRLSLTYKPAFAYLGAGASKYVGVSVADNQGKTLSVPQAATWLLSIQQPPVVASLTPASGKGSSQIFTLTISDPVGASDLATVQLLFGPSPALANVCAITYIAKQNQLALSVDSGATYAGVVTPGQATTVSNSQCTLNGAGSTAQLSGNSLVIAVNLQFTPAFALLGGGATKTIYALPLTVSGVGPSTGMTAIGTWILPLPSPTVDSISPSSGVGGAQSFALSVSDPLGVGDLATVQLLIGNSATLGNNCSVTYNAQQKLFALSNDAGTGSAGTLAAGQATTVSNSQCTLNGVGSSVQLSGATLVMTVSLQFTPAFATLGGGATKTIYALPLTTSGVGPAAGMTAIGTWTLSLQGPTVNSLTPSSGVGAAQSFALSVVDTLGASDLATVQLLFSSSATLGSSCSVTYLAQQRLLALSNDAGTGYAGTLAPGQATTVSNSQCTLLGSSSSVNPSGNTLTMVASLQFSTSFALRGGGATKNIYAKPLNAAGQGPADGYVLAGTWTIPQTTATGPVVLVSLAPLAGQGMAQAFTLTVSDTAGASDLALVHLIVTGPTIYNNACWVTYSAEKHAVGLVNDAASGYVGYVMPGQATSFSNSQCTLSGNGTSFQLSGNLLILTANLQFNSAFANIGDGSTKTVNGYPITAAGKAPDALVMMGTWRLGPALSNPPVVDSITPSSGQGSSQAFALRVSDPSGASDLATVQLLFGTSTATSSACSVTYLAQRGALGLTNDAGTGYSGYVTPGQPSTVSNSQCILSGSGSSIQTSGNALTMTANLQFTNAFASSGGSALKTIYALPVNAAGQTPSNGLAPVGTWTIPQSGAPAPPSVGTLTPSSGQGASQSFVLTVSDPAGASDLASVQVHFGSSTALGGACSVTYAAQQNSFSLLNDAGTASAGTLAMGQAASVSNSQCTLKGTGSSVSKSGTTLTMAVNLQFSTTFASLGSATKNVYAKPLNTAGQGPAGGFVTVGSWTVPQAASGPPAVVSVSPSTGQGNSASFVLIATAPGGASSLAKVQLLIGSSTALASACSVTYIAQQNTFGLTNDAGTGYAAYVSPSQATTISNTQCILNGSGSSVQLSGNTLTMTVSIQFSSAFAGAGNGPIKSVYAMPVDAAGQAPAAGMTLMGSWSVPQPVIGGPPAPISLTPASGRGASQAFTLVVSDTAGVTDLSAVHFIVSGPATLSNACWVTYLPLKNSFGLVTDSAAAYAGYVTPGQAASVSNSQCTLNGAGSSVQSSGSLLTMTVNLTFTQSFSDFGDGATKTNYAFPVNLAGKSPASLVAMGTWTLP